MASSTNVLRDGQWVSEAVNRGHAGLKARNVTDPTSASESATQSCGILTKTIVDTPAVRWILPARLRSKEHNDIAFIGDFFVHIYEMLDDGRLSHVAAKTNFPTRIRNAAVFGEDCSFQEVVHWIKTEEDDPMQDYGSSMPRLPPQMLVLSVAPGATVFLFMGSQTSREWTTIRYEGPKNNSSNLGYHMKIDPTMRYMVSAASEGIFIVHELESFANLRAQYAQSRPLMPIKSTRARSIRGIIHRLDFLHPGPRDDQLVALVLIVLGRHAPDESLVSRIIAFDWIAGDTNIFAKKPTYNFLPDDHKLPLLLIPLKLQMAVLLISQGCLGKVIDILSGIPNITNQDATMRPPTSLHYGSSPPLWTAWARPVRRGEYWNTSDNIYLAREDGLVALIEIKEDEGFVPDLADAGCVNNNVDTAFATVYDKFSDVLLVGGTTGNGGIYKVSPSPVPFELGNSALRGRLANPSCNI